MSNNNYQSKVDRIVKIQPSGNKMQDFQNQLKQACSYFIIEQEKLSDKLDTVKEAIYNRVLNPKQAAKILNISPGNVRKKIDKEQLKGYKENDTHYKTTVKHVLDYMKRQSHKYNKEITLEELIKLF